MKYYEFNKRVKGVEAQNAIISMLHDARILSIQMHNVQNEFDKNDIHGFTPGIIKTLNSEHRIMLDVLKNLDVIISSMDCDLGSVKYLVRDLIVDYEHENYEFEE